MGLLLGLLGGIYWVMTYLAVPIAAKDLDGAAELIRSAILAGAEMLELRTDYFDGLSTSLVRKLIGEIRDLTKKTPIPIIVTCRDYGQGGARDYPCRLRIDVLTEALEAGAEFVDFEYENFGAAENREQILAGLAENPKARLILSAHDFEGPFEDIEKLRGEISASYPAAIPKLVYRANHIADCFAGFDLLEKADEEVIVLCMGRAGLISRVLAKKLGSFVSFASMAEQKATAPGQLTIEQVKELYRWDNMNVHTELYGVIGSPVEHSVSPAIHNACFAEAGMNRLYLPLLVEGGSDGFERFMDGVMNRPKLGFRGFSVTIPHKRNALDFVKSRKGYVEPLAGRIGAVNTIVVGADGKLSGYNTDYAGALEAITRALNIERGRLANIKVAVVGAGGVSRAIVAGLCDAKAKVVIYNRTIAKAEKLAEQFGCEFAGLDELKQLEADLLVNCTSIGMHPNVNATVLPKEVHSRNMAVFDTVYNPAATLLLKDAKEAGAVTISGVEMFVKQAMAQFRLFTGQNANSALMREIVCKSLGTK